MKPTADVLINVARGGIVDDAALATALARWTTPGSAAALDVFEGEPAGHPGSARAGQCGVASARISPAPVTETRRAMTALAVDNCTGVVWPWPACRAATDDPQSERAGLSRHDTPIPSKESHP